MLRIIIVLGVVRCVLSNDLEFIRGRVFKSADLVNLESTISSYTVGCRLESVRRNKNGSFLKLFSVNEEIETRIVNDTTIEAKIIISPSNEATACGVKTYTCKLNQTPLDISSVSIGRPPLPIDESDFMCVSENREYIWCEFPRNDYCKLNTLFRLSMIRSFNSSECDLQNNGERKLFDSRTESCPFFAGHRSLTFELEATNMFGSTRTIFYINHYDFIRPTGPKMLEVTDIASTRVKVGWNLNVKLLYIDRKFEYEFEIASQHGVVNSSVTMSFDVNEKLYHTLDNLYAYTEYELRVRVRVIPMKPRKFENIYWSDWSSVTFQTIPSKPNRAPVIVTGGYSFKERKGDSVTIEVYWEHVPMSHQNGPGFSYNISAISKSGERFLPSFVGRAVAVFHQITIEHYRIIISCYNLLGSSDYNAIDIFPPAENFQPIVRRVLRNDSYQFSWFPPNDPTDLSNYTIMFCNFTATKHCQDSINFAVLPAYETTFNVTSESALNFGVSAVYPNHSSGFVWQECVVSTASGLSYPQFEVTDVTVTSFNLRMNSSCFDRSLVRRYGVLLWSGKKQNLLRYKTFEPYVTMVPIEGLDAGRGYMVEVVAYDEDDETYETRKFVHTVEEEKLLLKLFLLVCGVLGTIAAIISATKFVKRVKNITVDIPVGLIDIHDMLTTIRDNDGKEDVKCNELYDKKSEIVSNIDKELVFLPIIKSANENQYITNRCSVERVDPNKIEQMVISEGYVLPSQYNLPKEVNQINRLSNISSDYVVLK
ncbi:cytokine receptor-like isoform X2 [Toxorhynchites rutilus septentrionalis]|uniref:cytokine receptor-like isoform X2 n=1 Tax=Toxorhynchites rutilus septentrionalis TaxID=329112 RepID=UPI00247A7BD9|nr:cytokine receptor-like isoform X2 [Toxorhynchites rutilus septentrionalis]XP_055641350.1 cytokine receptor-like isoform X2 [Toxorhynchites rutilus septentrionalis]